MKALIEVYQQLQEQYYKHHINAFHDDKERAGKWYQLYQGTVQQLDWLLGEHADVGQVDIELQQTFSDLYKDTHNIRPRFHMSRQDALDWIDRHYGDHEPEPEYEHPKAPPSNAMALALQHAGARA